MTRRLDSQILAQAVRPSFLLSTCEDQPSGLAPVSFYHRRSKGSSGQEIVAVAFVQYGEQFLFVYLFSVVSTSAQIEST